MKALSPDPSSTAAHRLLAEVDLNRGRFDLALGQVDRVLEINPSDTDSAALKGGVLVWAGRAAEGLPWIERALHLDPANARTALYLGIADFLLGRYGQAVEALDRALVGNLGHNTQIVGRSVVAAAYAELDRPADAARKRNAAMQLSPFLDVCRFAGQFGAQQARGRMLDGLKKAGFR